MLRYMNQMTRLYWTNALFSGAKALASILGPIYLYRNGFSFQVIIMYFIVTALVKVAALFVVFKLAGSLGPKVTMVVGIVFMIVHFMCFASMVSLGTPLFIVGALLGLANAFFYPSFRMCFSFATQTNATGMQVAKLNSLSTLFTAVAPVIGGVVAGVAGVVATYYIAAGVFALALLFTAGQSIPSPKLGFHFKDIPRGAAVRDYFSNASYSTSGLADLLAWPLLIGLIIPTYAGIGMYAGLLVAASVGVQLWVGRVGDKKGDKLFLLGGAAVNVLYNALRLFASSVGHLVGLSMLSALSSSLLSSSYGARFYKNIHPQRHLEYLFMMEFANSITWLVYFPLLLWVSSVASFENTLRIGIILIVPAALGMTVMRSRGSMRKAEQRREVLVSPGQA